MYTCIRIIDQDVLSTIYEYEEQQLYKFKNEFDDLCMNISKLLGCKYIVCIHRWTDITNYSGDKPLDGYTATLQIDFKDDNDNLIEIDESICTFFENITFISFQYIKQKYMVFQNEELLEVRNSIKQFARSLENLY